LAVHGEESRGEQEQQEHQPPVPRATGHLREKMEVKIIVNRLLTLLVRAKICDMC